MHAGVDNRIVRIVGRQMIVRRVAIKCELQNAHARKTKALPQLLNVFSYDAEILCDDWQIAKCFLQRRKQFAAGSFDPLAVDRSLFSGGNLPARGESAEVIDAQQIKNLKRPTHAIAPPFEIVCAQALPVIKRIAPKLPRSAEVIRRHTRDDEGVTFIIKFEVFTMRPNVG